MLKKNKLPHFVVHWIFREPCKCGIPVTFFTISKTPFLKCDFKRRIFFQVNATTTAKTTGMWKRKQYSLAKQNSNHALILLLKRFYGHWLKNFTMAVTKDTVEKTKLICLLKFEVPHESFIVESFHTWKQFFSCKSLTKPPRQF